ncbi:MAG: putative quinol monooxygenase [Alphaproteobacteria bacterium]
MPKGTVTLTGYIDVPPERMDDIQAALPTHISLTRTEPGCLSFDVSPCPDVKGRFLVSEVFVDQQAFDAHQARTRASEWAKASEGIPREYSVRLEE